LSALDSPLYDVREAPIATALTATDAWTDDPHMSPTARGIPESGQVVFATGLNRARAIIRANTRSPWAALAAAWFVTRQNCIAGFVLGRHVRVRPYVAGMPESRLHFQLRVRGRLQAIDSAGCVMSYAIIRGPGVLIAQVLGVVAVILLIAAIATQLVGLVVAAAMPAVMALVFLGLRLVSKKMDAGREQRLANTPEGPIASV
jgi:hypothetical protein